jgi:ABC-2 type transport system ATP-binding protein
MHHHPRGLVDHQQVLVLVDHLIGHALAGGAGIDGRRRLDRRLDPLAAREFLQMLMDGVAALEATVVVASHVIADIERVADHIVLLSDGHVRLEGNVEEVLASHRVLTGARRPLGRISGVREIVRQRHSGRQMTLLVRLDRPVSDPSWSVDTIGLEELLLAYMAPERLAKPPPAREKGRLRWHG